MSVSHALGESELLSMLMAVHGTTPKFSSMDVQHWMAVPEQLALRHVLVEDHGELRHAREGFPGDPGRADVAPDLVELRDDRRVLVLQAPGPPEHLGEVDALDADPRPLEQLLAVPHGYECGGPGPDLAEARLPQSPHDAADPRERGQVAAELLGFGVHGVLGGEGVADPVLAEVCCTPTSSRRSCPAGARWPSARARRGTRGRGPGTSRPARRIVSAIPRSSPKLGSVTRMPSIFSLFALKSSAHFFASARDSTEPYFVSFGLRATASMPSSFSTASMVFRPCSQSSAGKKPRLPTRSPSVVMWILPGPVRRGQYCPAGAEHSWIGGGNDRSSRFKSQGFDLRSCVLRSQHDPIREGVTSPTHQLYRRQNTFEAHSRTFLSICYSIDTLSYASGPMGGALIFNYF